MNTRGPQRTEGYSQVRTLFDAKLGDTASLTHRHMQEGVTGLKALGVRDLTYKMIFMAGAVAPSEAKSGAINVRDEDATSESVVAELTESQRKELVEMKDDPRVSDSLTSIPSVGDLFDDVLRSCPGLRKNCTVHCTYHFRP